MNPLQSAKYRIAREMFVRTADDNYIVARRCLFEQLEVDFCWLAVHAVEKYLKAALLMNGQSSKGYSHDIVKLYEAVRITVAKELLSDFVFSKPESWKRFWRDEPPEEFLQRLYNLGNPNNRYQIYGYEREPEDLVKLDAIVFAIRRLCRCLDVEISPRIPDVTHRRVLTKQPNYWTLELNGNLERAVGGKNEVLRDAVCRWNLSFAPPDYAQSRGFIGASMRRSVLATEILKPVFKTTEQCAFLSELVDWVSGNIQVGEARQELREKVSCSQLALKRMLEEADDDTV